MARLYEIRDMQSALKSSNMNSACCYPFVCWLSCSNPWELEPAWGISRPAWHMSTGATCCTDRPPCLWKLQSKSQRAYTLGTVTCRKRLLLLGSLRKARQIYGSNWLPKQSLLILYRGKLAFLLPPNCKSLVKGPGLSYLTLEQGH